MEFPNLGEHCNWHQCKTLDFLPFTCAHCKMVFCQNHFNPGAHNCQDFQGESNITEGSVARFKCTFEGCSIMNPVEMICPKCLKHFCLTHRHHSCFNTPQEEIEAAKRLRETVKQQHEESLKEVNSLVSEGISKAMKNPKRQATALKVQLLRLKAKAEGPSNVPASERVHFLVCLPKNTKSTSKPIFVSKEWSVGRVIDAISDTCNVVNKNNQTKAPKLRLFKTTDGTQLTADLSSKLDTLITSGDIADGETVILEYISPDENLSSFVLTNFEQYKA